MNHSRTLSVGDISVSRPFDCITEFVFVEEKLGDADIILVPGGSVAQLAHRAADLYRDGIAPRILPSGGPNPKLPDWPSEWHFLRAVATEAGVPGVPGTAILREDRATNTHENARFSWSVIEREGLDVQAAVLVCKAHHSRRALLSYQAVFPRQVQFFVSPVVDSRGITRDNWFLDEDKTHVIFEELRKIAAYLENCVPAWSGRSRRAEP